MRSAKAAHSPLLKIVVEPGVLRS